MPPSRFQRRKEERPAEITAAAMAAFAENGYSATRVDDVARRAGVSKGLLYRYFETKEDLFKAVIRGFVSPRVREITQAADNPEMSVTEFLRGPFLTRVQRIPRSPLKILLRLMVSEGPKHPDLTAYYWQQVIEPALKALHRLIERGVQNGEFRRSALNDYPQLLVTPVLFSTLWNVVFARHHTLDTDRLLQGHIELILAAIAAPDTGRQAQ